MPVESPLLDTVSVPGDLRRLPKEALRQLADELRTETIDAASVTGGHFGAGLGVVELTVALHYVFDTPRDRLIWDVSHQAYPHKILTGRRDRIRTIRTQGGLYGFTKRSESEFDPFGAAHSSTSISAGLGMAKARDLSSGSNRVVSVIGDGALSAGMAYEALSNAGGLGTRMLVVLNDNNMSIAPSVGGITDYLCRLVGRDRFDRFADLQADLAQRYPEVLTTARRRLGGGAGTNAAGTIFDELGFTYVGPVDGHDIDRLIEILTLVRDADGPVFLHLVTEKGHGYGPAEGAADKGHATGSFDVATGAPHEPKAKPTGRKRPSYTGVFADALIAEADRDDRIVAITAAMPSGTGVDKFAAAYPDRSFDVGIAEQHAITFAAGLAAEGYRPFAAIYSTFLQRAYDQIVHDVALQNLPVRFAIDRAGLVGADGATHAGSFDVAYLACLPNFVVMAAADEAELVHMVATAARHDEGPIALRYPRGDGVGVPLPRRGRPLDIGKGRVLQTGKAIALLSFGGRLQECIAAADSLTLRGLTTTVADARFAKPLDRDLVCALSRDHDVLVTIEEGAIGGFATQVCHCLAEEGLLEGGARFRPMTLPDRFIAHGSPEGMYGDAGLKAADIVATAMAALGGMPMTSATAPFAHPLGSGAE